MPGNTIIINGASRFYVGDSKMPKLIKYLDRKGFPENKEAGEIIKEVGMTVGDK